MTRINVSCHCDDIRSKCRSGALIMSNWKMRRYIAYFNSNTVFPFSTDHLSELIKDMTNWLLSENFEFRMNDSAICAFNLSWFSAMSKEISSGLLSAFWFFSSISIFFCFYLWCIYVSFRFVRCHCGLSIWRRCQYHCEKLCLTWLKCSFCQFSWVKKNISFWNFSIKEQWTEWNLTASKK